jgi:hypothetical protein
MLNNRSFRRGWVIPLAAVFLFASPQSTLKDQMTTSERLGKFAWWPTKLSSSTDKYVGSAVCAQCHSDIAKKQAESEMGQTLMPAEQSEFLTSHYGKEVNVDGFTYRILHSGQGSAFSLKTGSRVVSKPLVWAFGSGKISQVYLTPENDTFNETHFSYFDSIPGFDVTPAQPTVGNLTRSRGPDPDSTRRATGRTVEEREARRCFSCHAANVPASGPIENVVPGVTCETCHGPGGNHTAAMRAGLEQGSALITNPGRLRPVDQVDFCGACHVTSMDILMAGNSGLPTVRFPAYRLQNSRCWRDDARIQCTACHDPHMPLVHEASSYDQKCLACHATAASKADAQRFAPACPVNTKDCTSCHMPKYEFPDVHHKFTDHDIRVVKPGAPLPG